MKTTAKSSLGNQLREAREAGKLTQAQVAKTLKCHVQQVSLWERGGSLGLKRLQQLCKFYGLDAGQMLVLAAKETNKKMKAK